VSRSTLQSQDPAPGADEPFRALINDVGISAIITRNDRIQYVNRSAVAMFDYESADDMVSLDLIDSCGAPYERERMRAYANSRRAGKPAPERYEASYQRRSGALFWAECNVHVTTWEGAPAIAIMLTDISSRKRSELTLHESQSRFQDFAEMGSDWLWEMDAELRYTYLSPRYSEITGKPIDKLIGRTRQEMYKGTIAEEKPRWEDFFETLAARRDFDDFIYTNWHADGRPLTMSNSGRALFDRDGTFTGYRGIGRNLTEQVATETQREAAITAAQIARQQLVDSIEGISDAFILYDTDDRLVLCNERYLELYPYLPPKEQLIGKTFEELIRLGLENRVVNDPVQRADPEAWLRQRIEIHLNPTGAPITQQWNDGRTIMIREWRTRDGGIVGVRSDITALKQAEQRLVDAIENIDEGFVLWDPGGRLILCNEKYRDSNQHVAHLLEPGVTFETILRSALQLNPNSPDRDVDAYVRTRLEEFHSGGGRRFEWQMPDNRWVLGTERRTSEGGVVAVRTDITALKSREMELSEARHKSEEAAELLAQRSAELERSNLDLEEFAHVASHDLKEPLRKIVAFGERLESRYADALDDDGKYYVERMAAAATRMQELITGLLNYARIGRGNVAFRPVDLSETVRRVASDLEYRLQESEGEITVDGDATVEAEPGLMHRLFLNLISNALKFRRPDAPPRIRVTLTEKQHNNQAFCHVTVADNGIGFDPALAKKVFRPFQRLHSREAYEGTGIGLAIVMRVVEHHGGTITVTSEEGVGTVFAFQLPLLHDDAGDGGLPEGGEQTK
jgi:PAS domain S-box-containing protein